MKYTGEHPAHEDHRNEGLAFDSTTVYGSAASRKQIPTLEMNDEELPPRTAYRFVKDLLDLDGKPSMNLASFVTTYQEPEAEQLMMENVSKNFIDLEEYPACGEIEKRCVNIVARLFNAPTDGNEEALGVSTVGSSEAIILATLAAKKRWQHQRREAGKDYSKPNLVMNSAVQVCWEKAARYLDVEERYVFCTNDRFVIDPKQAVSLVDENTILVCAILGTTYTGEYESVRELNDLLEKKNKAEGLDVHIHVDGASGGFVAPFVNPEFEFDFRVPLVCSINASGHKYGLSYAGVGFAIWRSKEFLPQEILFTVNYLGSDQISFTLNFSKSAIQVIAQYYNFLRFGKDGYTAIMKNLTATADHLADQVLKIGGGNKFILLSATGGKGLPLVAWRLKEKEAYDEFAIARGLRQKGWIVPAYTMAPNATKLRLLRVVVREDFSRSRCESFLLDLNAVMKDLEAMPAHIHKELEQLETAKKEKANAATADKKGQHPGESSHLNETTDKDNAIC